MTAEKNEGLDDVIKDVVAELDYAHETWGPGFDTKNTLSDWVTYVNVYLSSAAEMDSMEDSDYVYEQLIKASGLCASAAMHVRLNKIAPRHFDTQLGVQRRVDTANRVLSSIMAGALSVGEEERAAAKRVVDRLSAAKNKAPDTQRYESYIEQDLTGEATRIYEFGTGVNRYSYVIPRPKTLVYRAQGTTHRVTDHEGVVHCVPAPGHQACVLMWVPKDKSNPVQF